MELNLTGKVVLITGAGTGIGKAMAYEFLKEGCKVCICGRRQNQLEMTRNEFLEKGYDLMIKSVDVTDYNAFYNFADQVVNQHGKIDIFINNAAANQMKSIIDYNILEFQKMLDINLVSVFSGIKIAAMHMRQTGGGVIMNASSIAAIAPNAGRAPYSAAKAGVLTLTRCAAAELAKDNIRVLSYVPGVIETAFSAKVVEKNREGLLRDIPLKRFGQPEEVAKMLVFAASDAASYFNGTHIEIAGGKRCVQNPMYSYDN